MDHLTVDEIIGYVTAATVDVETQREIAKINLHILKCEDCLRRVRALQVISEGLETEMEMRQLRELMREKAKKLPPLTIKNKKQD